MTVLGRRIQCIRLANDKRLLKAVEKRYPGLDRVVCSMALGTGSPRHWNSWTGSRRK